jgi:single-strand DNA-binding protein
VVNVVHLVGNLGRDPEISYTSGGTAVCKASLATSERWTKDGERKEKTEWHNLVFWRRQAEVANEYLSKGSLIYVEGAIRYRAWDKPDGGKGYATDIEVQRFQMLDSRGVRDEKREARSETRQGQNATAENADFGAGGDDELPF